MKIEVADTVELNNGWVCQVDRMIGDDPDRVDECGVGPFVIDGSLYHQDGRFGYKGFGHPLSANRILRKASSFTLHDLQVGPGDVVEYDGTWGGEVERHTIAGWVGDKCYHMGQDFGGACSMNLNSCWRIISRASDDTPKLWRDMTEEERASVPADVLNDPTNPLRIPWGEWSEAAKGALLLAGHDGKVIEAIDPSSTPDAWEHTCVFLLWLAYRVKPKPFRETVTLMIDDGGMGGPRAIGTIDLIEGKPDRDSIKMEKL